MNEQQPTNTNGKPPQKINDPPKVPFTKNTERMMMVLCLAFMVLILAWKAPSITKAMESKPVIDKIYSSDIMADALVRHPGYLCKYFDTDTGGNKTIDIYKCIPPESTITDDTPLIIVYVENRNITDHVSISKDPNYKLIVENSDKK